VTESRTPTPLNERKGGRPMTRLTITEREMLSPGMVRLSFSGDLEAWASSGFTDRYVKMMFPGDDGPTMRTYTVHSLDAGAGTVGIDFVVHGDEGVAGPWAARAETGDSIDVRGPGGAYSPNPNADWHLLACDESGLPAVRAALADLGQDAEGYAVVSIVAEEHRQDLDAPEGIEISWVVGDLAPAVLALPWRDGTPDCFVHGEAESVMHGIRPYLLKERGVDRAHVSISGYWRQGRTEEGFRAWKRELSEAEGAAR
jgi:NADPH-dependent ferric siderophore reductase